MKKSNEQNKYLGYQSLSNDTLRALNISRISHESVVRMLGGGEFIKNYFQKLPYESVFPDYNLPKSIEEFSNNIHVPITANIRFIEPGSNGVHSSRNSSLLDSSGRKIFKNNWMVPERFMDFILNKGGSVLIDDIDKLDRRFYKCAESFRRTFEYESGITLFLSPPNTQSLPRHYDSVEVFVLQLYGSKIWSLYEPLDYTPNLRIPTKDVSEDDHIQPLKLWNRIILQPGQLLYVPSGWIHEVRNDTTNEYSMHVSVSVVIDAWITVFENILRSSYAQLCEEFVKDEFIPVTSVGIDMRVQSRIVSLLNQFEKILSGKILHSKLSGFFQHSNVSF